MKNNTTNVKYTNTEGFFLTKSRLFHFCYQLHKSADSVIPNCDLTFKNVLPNLKNKNIEQI